MQSKSILSLVAIAALAGCASPAQVLDGMEPQALEMAAQRGRFDLQCPSAQPTLLSRELTQPVEGIRFGGVPRGVFTVGVSGCGQRTTYQIFCPEGGYGCFSADTLEGVR